MNKNLEDYQKHYAVPSFEDHQVRLRKRKILEILGNYPHENLLEVGCGLESIFQDVDSFRQLTVVEPGTLFFEKAERDCKTSGRENIRLLNLFLEDSLPALAGEIFDFIIVSSLLHEIAEPATFIQTIHQLADESTVIHFNVPNARSFHRLLALEMGLIQSVFEFSSSNILMNQDRVYDMALLKQTLTGNGFEILESGSYLFKPFTHQQMERMMESNLISKQMLDGFYKMEKYLPDVGSEIFVNARKISA